MVPKFHLADVTPWIDALKASDDPREFYYDEFYVGLFECDYLTDEQKVDRLKIVVAALDGMMAKG